MSARITFARDFDPTSRTLFGPLLSVGYCLNRENVAVDAFAWVDFAAPIHSGDSDLVPEAGAAVGGFYAGRL
ncbi:MAG: hypothetical protein IRZ28_01470 [Steroidobacteraceae bacterium]|nr:hypothetical protein [Steroidobacteraceae bacterium]